MGIFLDCEPGFTPGPKCKCHCFSECQGLSTLKHEYTWYKRQGGNNLRTFMGHLIKNGTCEHPDLLNKFSKIREEHPELNVPNLPKLIG